MTGWFIAGAVATLLWLEHRRPLRRSVESKLSRGARNLAVAAAGAVALRMAEAPVATRLTAMTQRRRMGLLKKRRLPVWFETIAAVALLDYTLYLWHMLTHKTDWLWRFHIVHHADLDLDMTTGLRFHFGELVLSVAWRAGQIVFIGVSPRAFSIWKTWLFINVLFHHSNVKLPVEAERWLSRFIVTPRMHGIHHSIVREETDSNWSSGLTLWDKLHGTLRLNVPQQEITIGVPEYLDSHKVTLANLIAMPFEEQPTARQLPERAPSPVAAHRLLA